MPRALAIRYLTVDAGARPAYRARLAERAASARAEGYHLWAFEQRDAADRVVEFLEASTAAALDRALEIDDPPTDSPGWRADPGTPTTGWERYDGIPHAS